LACWNTTGWRKASVKTWMTRKESRKNPLNYCTCKMHKAMFLSRILKSKDAARPQRRAVKYGTKGLKLNSKRIKKTTVNSHPVEVVA
jgi:hypothetical protein